MAAQAADQGLAPGTSKVEARVYLAGRARHTLAAEAMAVSDPRSSYYRHFLTPEQIRARFAPSQAEIAAVTSWLTGAGFRVVESNTHYLAVQGNASAVSRAFGAHLHAYRKNGHVYTAPDASPPSPPRSPRTCSPSPAWTPPRTRPTTARRTPSPARPTPSSTRRRRRTTTASSPPARSPRPTAGSCRT